MKTCTKCEYVFDDAATNCSECGRRLMATSQVNPTAPPTSLNLLPIAQSNDDLVHRRGRAPDPQPEPTRPIAEGVGVILIPLNLSGIWMSRRTEQGHWLDGYWQVPGGLVEAGEKPDNAACRELHEETGILLGPSELVQVFSGLVPGRNKTPYRSTQYVRVSPEIPQNTEKGRHTPWELVSWERIPYLPTFGGIREMFGNYGTKFGPGQRAVKVGGSYQAAGVIMSVFPADDGTPRYVFRFDNPPGLLHIFSDKNLEPCQ